MSFPRYTQLDTMDCGPTCLRIIVAFYGRHYSLQNLRDRYHITREGVSLLGISDAAESIGLRSVGVKLTWQQLRDEANFPCIVHWNQGISWSSIKSRRNAGSGGSMFPIRP